MSESSKKWSPLKKFLWSWFIQKWILWALWSIPKQSSSIHVVKIDKPCWCPALNLSFVKIWVWINLKAQSKGRRHQIPRSLFVLAWLFNYPMPTVFLTWFRTSHGSNNPPRNFKKLAGKGSSAIHQRNHSGCFAGLSWSPMRPFRYIHWLSSHSSRNVSRETSLFLHDRDGR